ncbi:MAG: NAD(P)H-dependent oxidoreductase [Telluria sp.]
MERTRVLLINGSQQDERTGRMICLAQELLEADGLETDVLDPAVHRNADVYEKWLFAHAVMIIAPTGSSTIAQHVKPHIDRLTAAGYTAHFADRAYGVVVHGRGTAIDSTRPLLTGWLDAMGMVDSDSFATLDRHLGYHEQFDNGELAGDGDEDCQEEVRNVARAVRNAVTELRAGRLSPPERRARAA